MQSVTPQMYPSILQAAQQAVPHLQKDNKYGAVYNRPVSFMQKLYSPVQKAGRYAADNICKTDISALRPFCRYTKA